MFLRRGQITFAPPRIWMYTVDALKHLKENKNIECETMLYWLGVQRKQYCE